MRPWLRRWWLVGLLWLSACSEPEVALHVQQSFVFGTSVEVSIAGMPEPQAQQAANAVLQEFDRLHHSLHAWKPSALSTLNAALADGRSAPVDAELQALLVDARTVSELSGGLFNPAIGGLIAAWGFQGDDFGRRLPTPAELQPLLAARPLMGDLEIGSGRVSSRNPAVRLDLGGYAKGYALDRAAQLLRQHGVRHALVNIGGNILALGQRGNRPWRVGIQHPRQSGALAVLDLHDGEAIGTSGDYQRYFEHEGRRYSHLIDPRTGQPAQGVQAVTVLFPPGPDAGTRSDARSKPLFIASAEAWPALAQRLQAQRVLRIDARGEVWVTSALKSRLTFLTPVVVHEIP